MLGAVIKNRLSESRLSTRQNASRAYQPVGEVPTCISVVYVSDKWTVECFQPTHLKHIRFYYLPNLCRLPKL
jgi:hypothetical protein